FDAITPLIAASISASSNTINGACPPNSIEALFKVSAEFFKICFPTGVDPVKVIFLTSGLLVISSPISCAQPKTKFRTTLSKLASCKYLNISIAYNGVIVAGFNTHVHPAAMAGANLQLIIDKGKFQGGIAAHT